MSASQVFDLTPSAGPRAAVRRRVAVVVQRFGPGIAGGAEWHAQALVSALRAHHEVTVLTSCARDSDTWAIHFAPGVTLVDGVTVRRFAHPPRNDGGRARVPWRHKIRFILRVVLDALNITRVAAPRGNARLDGHVFLQRQGPACPGLIDELRAGHDDYDAIVFFSALYYPTAEGLPVWGQRSVLIPTLHDEKPMYLPWFHRVFAAAGHTLYNTEAERRLAQRLYGASAAHGQVVGTGVRVRTPSPKQVELARARHGVPQRYLIYVGRIERGKGCDELLAAWRGIEPRVGDAALVFVGKGSMPIETSARVLATGFVPDEERDALVAGAAALVLPSRLESLSLVLLEAMALGVPTLVNAGCEVLADHLRASDAGEAYRGSRQLRACLQRALERTDAQRRRLGDAGRRHVAGRYVWEVVIQQWLAAIERTCESAATR